MSSVKPLAELCENYIVKHFEKFPVSHLSLLPLTIRRDLLWRLPIADVCLRLENTDFVKGLDMAAYWKLPCENFPNDPDITFPKDSDIDDYIKERWPSEADYAKAKLYGRIATSRMGGLPSGDLNELVMPHDAYVDLDAFNGTVLFLYGVRELHGDERNRLTIPPRYHQNVTHLGQPDSDLSLTTSKKLDEEILDVTMHCFNGERPKMLPEFLLYHADVIYCNMKLSEAELRFLSEVEYVGMHCKPFLSRGVDFTISLVNVATNLRVLILQGLNVPEEDLYLDYFCEQLATCQPFLAKFQILKIVAGILEVEELETDYGVDTPEEYTVSQASLDQLIIAYFSAPTDHSQLVQLSFTNIDCEDTDCSPAIDRTYLQFKNIRLSDCCFDSNKATPDSISKWLGQEIKVLEKEEKTSSFLFQIDHKDGVVGHKRKYSEAVHSESDDQLD